MREEWKDIKNYNGWYQVSNFGRVRSFKRGRRIIVMSPSTSKCGYQRVNLWDSDKRLTKLVHRLVLEAFSEKIKDKNYCNHKDGNKKNNHISNLEWVSSGDNQRHSIITGLKIYSVGIDVHNSKLNNSDVKYIRLIYSSGKFSQYELAKKFGVTQMTIHNVIHRKIWRHVQ